MKQWLCDSCYLGYPVLVHSTLPQKCSLIQTFHKITIICANNYWAKWLNEMTTICENKTKFGKFP